MTSLSIDLSKFDTHDVKKFNGLISEIRAQGLQRYCNVTYTEGLDHVCITVTDTTLINALEPAKLDSNAMAWFVLVWVLLHGNPAHPRWALAVEKYHGCYKVGLPQVVSAATLWDTFTLPGLDGSFVSVGIRHSDDLMWSQIHRACNKSADWVPDSMLVGVDGFTINKSVQFWIFPKHFVSRDIAAVLAYVNGQIVDIGLFNPKELFSEDLY